MALRPQHGHRRAEEKPVGLPGPQGNALPPRLLTAPVSRKPSRGPENRVPSTEQVPRDEAVGILGRAAQGPERVQGGRKMRRAVTTRSV